MIHCDADVGNCTDGTIVWLHWGGEKNGKHENGVRAGFALLLVGE